MRPILDAHLDLAWNALQWNRDLTLPLDAVRAHEAQLRDHPSRGRNTVTLPELRRAHVAACLGTILVRARANTTALARRDLDFCNQDVAFAVGLGQLAWYQRMQELGHVRLLTTAEALRGHWPAWNAAPDTEPLGVLLAMEGADPIPSLEHVHRWFEQGLRCVGLAHYGPGPYAMGTGGEGPVTPAGRALLGEFEQCGMILDLTHTAEPGFWQVLEWFSGPVHASHNMCRALVPGDRQFSDEQIDALLQRGAIIGMALDAWMLVPGWIRGTTDPRVVSLSAVADHVDHICQRAGNAAHVGIGSDLDGGFGTEQCPHDLASIAALQQLDQLLQQRGYGDADIAGIFADNWRRFFETHLPTAVP